MTTRAETAPRAGFNDSEARMIPTTFPLELAFNPIVPDQHVFLVLKPGSLPDRVLLGQCVGFDSIAITIRLEAIPIALVVPWNNIAGVLPLTPDWALQADEKHKQLLATIARLWERGKRLRGRTLNKVRAQYTQDIVAPA